MRRILSLVAVVWAVVVVAPLVGAEGGFVTTERFVPHVSTVPANAGELVGIYLREKTSDAVAVTLAGDGGSSGKVVLFVHGGSVPSIPDYDLDYKDYSWMGYLAQAGYDTFAMDQSGYGRSPRPMMDDPCNLAADDQALVTPHPLAGPAVMGFTQLVMRRDVDDRVRQDLEKILAESKRASKIITNLQSFARRYKPKKDPVNIIDMVRKVSLPSLF